jgi:hypothetical protein
MGEPSQRLTSPHLLAIPHRPSAEFRLRGNGSGVEEGPTQTCRPGLKITESFGYRIRNLMPDINEGRALFGVRDFQGGSMKLRRLISKRNTVVGGATIVAATTMLVVTTATANAATSESDAYWNDQPVAKAWFNSGLSNPSKGPNSFTIKVVDGASSATLWYQIDGQSAQTRTVNGSGHELSFSVSGSPTSHKGIGYGVCGVYWGNRVCGPYRDDTVK